MSVISCRLIGEGRSGALEPYYVRTFKQRWRVETNNTLDGPKVVLAPHGLSGFDELPTQYVSTYDSGNDADSQALCVSVNADEEGDSRKSWIVTADFSTVPPTNPAQLTPNPLLELPLYSFTFDQYTEVARQAYRANFSTGDVLTGTLQAVRNSVGEVFRPGVEVDACRAVYVVQKNFAIAEPGYVMPYVNAVNATAWKGCPPRTAKCRAINCSQLQQRNNIDYYTMTFEFHLNPQTWDLFILNESSWHYDLTLGKLVKLSAAEGLKTIYNGTTLTNGLAVPQDTLNTAVPQPSAIYVRYRYYQELEFNSFPF